MADEVKRGFHNVRSFYSLFGQFTTLVISNNVCAGSDFADADILRWEAFCVFTIWDMRSLYG